MHSDDKKAHSKRVRVDSYGVEEASTLDAGMQTPQGESGGTTKTTPPSTGSSGQEITTALLNKKLYVAMEGAEEEITLNISTVRPPTSLERDTQGDHVTAYIAYLHILITAVEGEDIREAAGTIIEAAKAILPDKAQVFDSSLEELRPSLDSTVSRTTRREARELLLSQGWNEEKVNQIHEALKRDKKATYMNAVRKISQKFLEEVNLDEEVAFAKVGEKDHSAGEQEKSAIHTLKVINELEKTINTPGTEEKFDRIYEACIKPNALYIRGMNRVFGHQVVDQIRNQWGAAKDENEIVKANLIDQLKQLYNDKMNCDVSRYTSISSSGYNLRSRSSVSAISSSSSSSAQPQSTRKVALISECFGDLFDFKWETHKTKEDAQKLLYRVTSRHITAMFNAFNELKTFDPNLQNLIIDNFLKDEVLVKQGWENADVLVGIQRVQLNEEIVKNSLDQYLDINTFKMKTTLQQNAHHRDIDLSRDLGL